jgi:hypothetical protein
MIGEVPRNLNKIKRVLKLDFYKATLAIFGLVLIIVCSYAATVIILTWPISEFSIAKAGVFGDSFGIITSLFSGLAFAGIIITILLQRQELSESREIFKLQRFEGSFYRLLDFYRKNLENIKISEPQAETIYYGVDALNLICKKLNQAMQKYNHFLEIEEGRKIYENQLFIEIQKILCRQARYLGTLLNLLELIERDIPEHDDRIPYWNIIASQLTAIEVKYIFYCCLVAKENDPLREIIHRSTLIYVRISEAHLSKTNIALYKRIYNVDLNTSKNGMVLPHDTNEIRRIKKEIRMKKQIQKNVA